jgi:hypothetical protein
MATSFLGRISDSGRLQIDPDDLRKGLMPDDLVAFAGGLFETRPIEDFDFTSPVTDEAGVLKRPARRA